MYWLTDARLPCLKHYNSGMHLICAGGGDVPVMPLLIEAANKRRPRVLFIPTASSDDPSYIEMVSTMVPRLGAEFDVMRMADIPQGRHLIAAADAIYVGGGNTKMMLDLWRRHDLHHWLRAAADAGVPIGGVSAGAICWARLCNSDWPLYEQIPGVATAPLEGLGWIDLALCPHTSGEGHRLADFTAMFAWTRGVGIGLDDGTALEIRDSHYRIIGGRAGTLAHRLERVDGLVTHTGLEPHADFRPISEI